MALMPTGPTMDGYKAAQVQNPYAVQLQQLAAHLAGGGPHNDPLQLLQGIHPTYTPTQPVDTGYNPAQYQRAVGNTAQAYNDWMAHHPGAVAAGNLPGWAAQYQAQQLLNDVNGGVPANTPPAGMNPSAVHAQLSDAINFHRANNGVAAMHPEELHARVTELAHELLGQRANRAKRALKGLYPNPSPAPITPVNLS